MRFAIFSSQVYFVFLVCWYCDMMPPQFPCLVLNKKKKTNRFRCLRMCWPRIVLRTSQGNLDSWLVIDCKSLIIIGRMKDKEKSHEG